MAYRINTACPGMTKAVRGIAVEQLDTALALIEGAGDSPHKTVHEVRKACKRMRGLLRLIAPGFADFAKEDRAVAKAARRLSNLRDAAAMVETFDALKKWPRAPWTAARWTRSAPCSPRARTTCRRRKATWPRF